MAKKKKVQKMRYFYVVLAYTTAPQVVKDKVVKKSKTGSVTLYLGQQDGSFPNFDDLKHHGRVTIGDLRATVQVNYIYEFKTQKDYEDASRKGESAQHEVSAGASESAESDT